MGKNKNKKAKLATQRYVNCVANLMCSRCKLFLNSADHARFFQFILFFAMITVDKTMIIETTNVIPIN